MTQRRAFVLLLGLLLGTQLGAAALRSRRVEATRIDVVHPDGTLAITLEATETGSRIVLRDATGRERIVFAVDQDASSLTLLPPDEVGPKATLSAAVPGVGARPGAWLTLGEVGDGVLLRAPGDGDNALIIDVPGEPRFILDPKRTSVSGLPGPRAHPIPPLGD